MIAYPLFFDLRGQSVLVFGAGRVGRRKIAGLLPCEPAEILVLDIDAASAAQLPDYPALRFECRTFTPDDLRGRALVFICSGDRKANAELTELCRLEHIPCNVADNPEEGTFQVPALFASGAFQAAFSTGGFSPALGRRMAAECAEKYGVLLVFMGRLRPLVLEQGDDPETNAALFRSIVDSELAELLRESAPERECAALLRAVLPQKLHKYIGDLLHELV